VSFAEILMRKSVAGFGAVTTQPDVAYRWATLTFFGGMVIIAVLDRVGGQCLEMAESSGQPAGGALVGVKVQH
jgi:hypothetical protein